MNTRTFIAGLVVMLMFVLPFPGITEDGLRAYCDSKNGIWFSDLEGTGTDGKNHVLSVCTEDSITYPEYGGRYSHTMPNGYMFVWWDKATRTAQMNR